MNETFWGCEDDMKIVYRWEYDLAGFPESIEIHEFVNDKLKEVTKIKEDMITEAVIALLWMKGYTVIGPKGEE